MKSIRWKLILVTFLLVFAPMYYLNRYTIESFDQFTSKAQEEEMITQAVMLGEHYKATMLGEDAIPLAEALIDYTELPMPTIQWDFAVGVGTCRTAWHCLIVAQILIHVLTTNSLLLVILVRVPL